MPAERFSKLSDIGDENVVIQMYLSICRYAIWYLMMERSLSGVVQFSLKAGFPATTSLLKEMSLMFKGTVSQENKN